jgi:phage terminase small subunit
LSDRGRGTNSRPPPRTAGKTVTLRLRKNASKRPPTKRRPVKAIPGRTSNKIERAGAPPLLSPLTERQKLFVTEYLVDLNATRAAIRAGYSAQTARQTGSENLSKPYIAAEIERAMDERGGITRTRLIEELAKIAFSDIGKVVKWGPEPAVIRTPENGVAIKRMVSRVTWRDSDEIEDDVRGAVAEVSHGANGALHVKMHDKVAALHTLARVLGMYRIKVDVSHTRPARVVFEYYGAPDEVLARHTSSPEAAGDDGDRDD